MKPKSIERNGARLKDWQVVRVEVDAKGDMRLIANREPYKSRVCRAANYNKAPRYKKAFDDKDWKWFDSEYDTALTFDWC